MPSGGARQGSGRKRKPLSEKLENGPGRQDIIYIPHTAMGDIYGGEMPPPEEWLQEETQNARRTNIADKIYERTWKWIKAYKCDHLITIEQIEQYAASVARYAQCEEGINKYGLLIKHPTGMPIANPYVAMSEKYLKRANLLWDRIYQKVKDNCSIRVGVNPIEDVIEGILKGKIRER